MGSAGVILIAVALFGLVGYSHAVAGNIDVTSVVTNPTYIWDSNGNTPFTTAIEETQVTFSMTTGIGDDFYLGYVVNGGQAVRHGNSLTVAGTSVLVPFDDLSDGAYAITITAYNGANVDSTSLSFDFVVDTKAPETAILTTPAKITGDRFGKFTFSSNEVSDDYGDVSFMCSVSGVTNGFVSCGTCDAGVDPCIGNYTMDLSGQKDGPYTFRVYSTNTFKSGVVQSDPTPDTYVFTLDATPPKIVVTKSPAVRSSSTKASFDFHCKDKHACTFWCKLDGLSIDGFAQKTWSKCSSPTVLNVTPKSHVFEVIAKDVANNTSPDWDVFNFYVDTTAPKANFIANSTLRAIYIEHDDQLPNWMQPTGKYGTVNYPSRVPLNGVPTSNVLLSTNSPNAMFAFNCSHPSYA
eukprot:jgi/Mesvir1/20437/Mv12334-RA.1